MLSITGLEPGSGSNFESINLLDAYINGKISTVFSSVPYGYLAESVDGKIELLKSVANHPAIVNFMSIATFLPVSHPSEIHTIVYIDTAISSFFSEVFRYGYLIITSTVSAPVNSTNIVIYGALDIITNFFNNISGAFIHALDSDKQFEHLFNIFQLDILALTTNLFTTIFCKIFIHWLHFGDSAGSYYFVEPLVIENNFIGDWYMYIQSWNRDGRSGSAIVLGLNIFDASFSIGIGGIHNLLNLYHMDMHYGNFHNVDMPVERLFALRIGLYGLTCINTVLYYLFFI